ncbi:dual specificity protein phosphatase 7-like [Haliotis rubra]|uniref:dual specificity protein phosphatase 7-like n=1 Tax=Haliotis rubra TaxID=36100 RepID=UPI001EE5844C|nr:dual specificity protein phosphatase 7-like [Haliotis rubra]
MPCLEVFNSMSSDIGDFCSPEILCDEMRNGEKVLLLDCRCQADYIRSHVAGSINVTLPSLMFKRLKKGTLQIATVIQKNEAKERFNKCCKTHLIVLYDECSTDLNANPSSTINLLVKKLRQDGCRASFLLGGFSTFEERFPEYCNSQENTESTILGLRNLRISEDSSYGTSSESDCENTPHMSPFPVQVLPHLYLGNAKNSSDINQLKKYGITYILNVTPNVPNMFENDTSFKYLQIPISDHWSQNLSAFFPQALAFIDEARRDHQGVLVHCLAGISRSVTVTVAYMMSRQAMSLNEAYDYVKTCKPNISPNFTFMGQLLDFEKSLERPEFGCAECEAKDRMFCKECTDEAVSLSSPETSPLAKVES